MITGIGFLGAGAILKRNEQGQIYGLTTASGIWLTAAVGIAAGMGREVSAILATLLAFVILSLAPREENRPQASFNEKGVRERPSPSPNVPLGPEHTNEIAE